MRQDLKDRVIPHTTEYIVMVGDMVLPVTKGIAYRRVASFIHKEHAEKFADSIKSFHTAVIPPSENGRPLYDTSPIFYSGQVIDLWAPVGERVYANTRPLPEGWDG